MRNAPLLLVAVPALLAARPAPACTSYLVTKGASVDGSTMMTYSADSHELFGELVHLPAGAHQAGTTIEVLDWDTRKSLGRIPQAARTFQVVGNMNEHQVAIGETTFGGRKELKDPEGRVDYGSLMYLALQRARTAREAIGVMTSLVDEHGYASEGESFSITDPGEAWIMDMIGKGPKNRGAVWVARRVPDGFVSAHANAARIRRFPLDDPKNTLYAKDVISFARGKGFFQGRDADFSFADAYAPQTFGQRRFCDARVWQFFRRVAPSLKLPDAWVKGDPRAEPLPLWIKPDRPLAARDVMELMRDHFEGTDLDLSKGVGAGPFHLPYRWRPLTWKLGDSEYLNERSASTQQTGFSFVAQSRASLPAPIGGVLWFGVDDTYSTVYVPMYCGIREAPHAFAVGTATFDRFSWDSAFWVFNFVANLAYQRYQDMIVDVQAVQRELEGDFAARQAEVEKAATKLFQDSPELARDYLTRYSVEASARTIARWRDLGIAMFVKYLDGNVRDSQGKVTHPRYPDDWYRRIVDESGESLKVRPLPGQPADD
jgi:dipeptidase